MHQLHSPEEHGQALETVSSRDMADMHKLLVEVILIISWTFHSTCCMLHVIFVRSPACGAEYVFKLSFVIPGASSEHVFNYSFFTLVAQLPTPGLSFHGDALLQLIVLGTCGNLVFKIHLEDRDYASWEI